MGIVSLIHVIVGFGLPEASHTNTACRAFSTTWGWEYRYSWCENDNANVGNVDNVEQIWMTMLIHDENTFMAGFWIICGKPAGRAFSAKRNNVFRVLNSLRSLSFRHTNHDMASPPDILSATRNHVSWMKLRWIYSEVKIHSEKFSLILVILVIQFKWILFYDIIHSSVISSSADIQSSSPSKTVRSAVAETGSPFPFSATHS